MRSEAEEKAALCRPTAAEDIEEVYSPSLQRSEDSDPNEMTDNTPEARVKVRLRTARWLGFALLTLPYMGLRRSTRSWRSRRKRKRTEKRRTSRACVTTTSNTPTQKQRFGQKKSRPMKSTNFVPFGCCFLCMVVTRCAQRHQAEERGRMGLPMGRGEQGGVHSARGDAAQGIVLPAFIQAHVSMLTVRCSISTARSSTSTCTPPTCR